MTQTQPEQPEALQIADLLDACDPDADLPFIATFTLASIKRTSAELRRLHAEKEQLRSAMNIPTIEKGSQDWLSSDPAIAWHQIDRYADNWADIGLMMQEYIDAQKQSAVEQIQAELVREAQRTANEKQRADQMTEQHRMQAKMNSEARAELAQLRESKPLIARQLGEWHEDDGPVAWWAWCGHEWAGEPAWVGTPNSSDWPGYHTHWTPHPAQPDAHGIGEKTNG